MATQLGLRIPETSITNDVAAARELLRGGSVVAKPIRTALVGLGDEERVIFTNRIASEAELDVPSVQAAPIIFQREIPKEADIRVTVVGARIFAVAIDSQSGADTQVDWRKGANVSLEHTPIELPGEIEEKCLALVQQLGLRFGAIDLVKDVNGEYWFLEINPNGQWAWIEQRTRLPISAAIVDELVAISRK